MGKKLRYFGEELRRSALFNIVVVIGSIACIVLIATVLYQNKIASQYTAFYKQSMADKNFVEFRQETMDRKTMGDLADILSADDIAALAAAGTVSTADDSIGSITVVTPALAKNMPSLGHGFSSELPDGYREAYVASAMSNSFKKNLIYTVRLIDGNLLNIKIKGYIKPGELYYVFEGSSILGTGSDIVVCDNIPSDSYIYSGIFFNDKPADYFRKLGFSVNPVKSMIPEDESAGIMRYIATLLSFVLFMAVFINYMINLDKTRKRFAIQHVVGVGGKLLTITECAKMALIYLLALASAFIVGAILTAAEGTAYQNAIIDAESIGLSSLIILAVYAFTVLSGIIGFIKIKPLAALKDETKE